MTLKFRPYTSYFPFKFPTGSYCATTYLFPDRSCATPKPSFLLPFQTSCVKWPHPVQPVSNLCWLNFTSPFFNLTWQHWPSPQCVNSLYHFSTDFRTASICKYCSWAKDDYISLTLSIINTLVQVLSNLVSSLQSLIDNRIAGLRLAPEVFKARSRGWDWSMGST